MDQMPDTKRYLLAARLSNEILLNVFRTLKWSEFPEDMQKVMLDCIGKVLIQSAREDLSMDERIQRIEEILYSDTREFLSRNGILFSETKE